MSAEDSLDDYKVSQTIKSVFVGVTGVGKTSILKRYVNDTFDTQAPTIGVDYLVKKVQTPDRSLKLQLWDTAGAERFATLTTTYYRSAHVVVIVFDVTNDKSVDAVDRYVEQARANAPEYVTIILVGNKADLIEEKVVTKTMGEKLRDQHGCAGYFECSAKDSFGVDELFQCLVTNITVKFPTQSIKLATPEKPRAPNDGTTKEKKPCCGT